MLILNCNGKEVFRDVLGKLDLQVYGASHLVCLQGKANMAKWFEHHAVSILFRGGDDCDSSQGDEQRWTFNVRIC